MSIVRLPIRPTARAAPRSAGRAASGLLPQALAIGGAFLMGIVIALATPGVSRGAEPEAAPGPVGVADGYDAPHDGRLRVEAGSGVLANDTGEGLAAELWTEPVFGGVTLAADGSFSYTRSEPAEDDTFAYLAVDAAGVASEPVAVTIRFANRAPACSLPQAVVVRPGAQLELDLDSVCTDPDGDPLSYDYHRPDIPAGSIWEADTEGHIRFLPPPDWTGTAILLFTADDGLRATMPLVLTIKVVDPG